MAAAGVKSVIRQDTELEDTALNFTYIRLCYQDKLYFRGPTVLRGARKVNECCGLDW